MSFGKLQVQFAPKAAVSAELKPRDAVPMSGTGSEAMAQFPAREWDEVAARFGMAPEILTAPLSTEGVTCMMIAKHEPVLFARARAHRVCPICLRIGCPWVHSSEAKAMGF